MCGARAILKSQTVIIDQTDSGNLSVGGNAQLAYATGRGIQPNGIRVTENVEFKIHTENAGQGEVKVKINGPGKSTCTDQNDLLT